VTKLPSNWKRVRFDSITRIENGQVSPLEDCYADRLYLGPENIESGTGAISGLKTCRALGLTSGKYPFRAGAIVYSKIRPNLNKVCLVDFDGVSSADAYPIYVNAEVAAAFLVQVMRSPMFVRQAIATSARTGMPKVNREELGSFIVPIPPFSEQQTIAAILHAWDRGIEKLQQLIIVKTDRMGALRRDLLFGEQRFSFARRAKWQCVQLSEVLKHIFRPVNWSPNDVYRLISIRRRCGGLFRREDLRGADYKTTDLHEIRTGDFLVSKRQVVHGAWGMVTKEFSGCHVSKEYSILVNKAPDVLHMPFFDWLCHEQRMWHLAFLASDGVHREKLIFDSKDFLRHYIELPPTIEEQKHIVQVLDACDREIRLLEAELEALKQQKRGLMQKLLTGEIRVKTK